jgi:hypothetical protein
MVRVCRFRCWIDLYNVKSYLDRPALKPPVKLSAVATVSIFNNYSYNPSFQKIFCTGDRRLLMMTSEKDHKELEVTQHRSTPL